MFLFTINKYYQLQQIQASLLLTQSIIDFSRALLPVGISSLFSLHMHSLHALRQALGHANVHENC